MPLALVGLLAAGRWPGAVLTGARLGVRDVEPMSGACEDSCEPLVQR